MNNLVKSNGNIRNAFFSELPALFDDLFVKDLFHLQPSKHSNHLPAVNVKDTTKAYEIEVVAPGMEKKDFKVEVKDNTLFISAKKENNTEEKDKEDRYVRKEFGFYSFTRSFVLPQDTVDSGNISAAYKDGILNITVPKKEKAVNSKEISID
jgi:HSP20 family protein